MLSPSICPISTGELLSVASRIQPEGDAACGIAHLVHKDVYIVGVEGTPVLYAILDLITVFWAPRLSTIIFLQK